MLVDTITGSSSATGDQFGFSIDCDTAGDTLVVGAPYAEVQTQVQQVLTDAGEAYLFHHIAEKFTADGTAFAFTTTNTLPAQFYVEVDGVLQTLTDGRFGGFDTDSSYNPLHS